MLPMRAPTSLETAVHQEDQDRIVLFMEHARLRAYSARREQGLCFNEPAPTISIWGVCLTHGVVADIGHHASMGGSLD